MTCKTPDLNKMKHPIHGTQKPGLNKIKHPIYDMQNTRFK